MTGYRNIQTKLKNSIAKYTSDNVYFFISRPSKKICNLLLFYKQTVDWISKSTTTYDPFEVQIKTIIYTLLTIYTDTNDENIFTFILDLIDKL